MAEPFDFTLLQIVCVWIVSIYLKYMEVVYVRFEKEIPSA